MPQALNSLGTPVAMFEGVLLRPVLVDNILYQFAGAGDVAGPVAGRLVVAWQAVPPRKQEAHSSSADLLVPTLQWSCLRHAHRSPPYR